MREKRSVKKIFQTTVFTLFAFFIFGAVSVDAKTVSVDRSTFLTMFGDDTSDVIQLSESVDLSDINSKYPIYIYKDKTIDLKGNTLTLPNYKIEIWYYTNATVRFIDSSNSKTGQILGANNSDGSIPLISTWNENPTTYTETYLVFDGVKISRNTDKGPGYVVAPTSNKKIGKVSFINTDISNFAFLNKGDTAANYYYENITFQRGVTTHGFLLNEKDILISDVISDNSKIIKEYKSGTYRTTFSNDTKMDQVYTDGDVIKVVYKSGISVSNINFDTINYKDSPVSKNITITNSGEEDIEITNVSVSSSDFVVTGPTSGVTLSSGSADTSWSIKPKDGLGGGTYVNVITVTAGGRTYTSTVTLTVKEVDSEGKDVVYVTTTDELSSAINARTKTIKLANDLKYNNGWVSIPVYGDTTIDLNGKTIYTKTGNFGLNYQDAATIKIIDSSNAKTGKIVENGAGSNGASGGIIQLVNNVSDTTKECNFVIDGVNVTSESTRSYAMILVGGDNNLKSVKLVNSLFSNYQYILNGSMVDKITFENVKATSGASQYVYLVQGRSDLTFGDIITSESEVAYLDTDGSFKEFISNDRSLTSGLNVYNGQSIQVRYKSGFNVTNVELNETYGYTDASVKDIAIKNRGTSALQINTVTVDSSNFVVVPGTQSTIYPGATDTTWKIKSKVGLDAGNYTATIKVTDTDNNTYTGTVKLTVTQKELTGLKIGGVDSTITYGTDYTPTLTGTTELGSGDYTIKYAQKDGETYTDLGSSKPAGIGEYKVTISITNENYKQIEVSTTYAIVPKKIEPSVGYIAPEKYTGEEITPSITVFNGATMLIEGDDYTFEYANNTNAGMAKVIVKPVVGSCYTFTKFEREFKILPKSITADSVSVTLDNTSYRYTGSEIKPEPVVKDGEKTLVKDTDYELVYSNNTNICDNTAKVYVKGIGNYEDGVTKYFSIIAKETQTISFNETSVNKTYGNDSFKITANHTQGNGTVKYTSSNTDVAEVNETTGLVTIKKAGTTTIKATASETEDYGEGVATYSLTVAKKEISINRAAVNSKEYDGTKTAEVNYVIFRGLLSDTLEKDVDFTATAEFNSESMGYSKPVTIKVVLKDTAKANNYILTNNEYQTRATINGKTIQDSWVTVDTTTTYTYNGSYIEPVVTVKDPTGTTTLTLTKGTHYTVEYSDNLNAGTGKIKVAGTGNYAGLIEKEFTINKKSITPTVEDITAVTYNGSEHTPELVVKDGSTTLVKGTDYIVEYTNNLRAGNACAEISEVSSSNYTFTPVGKDFTINKYEIKASDVTLEYTSILFDGNAKKPSVTVKMGSEVIPPIDYNVDYSNNTNVGTATVKVTVKADSDDFTGEVIKNFEIVNKTLLTISGIENNQQITYTGNPVVLAGNLTVSNEIDPNSLTVKWYSEDTEISKPINAGRYKVVYSYEDEDYIGILTIDFEITKKVSTIPTLNSYKGVVGDKLSTIALPEGFGWSNSDEEIILGNKEYNATYVENNDKNNYTTETVQLSVYGKAKVNLNTSVNGIGGTISTSKTDVLEGTTETIIFNADLGFKIDKVEVNGVDKTDAIIDNKLDVDIENTDVNVVVTYKIIQYTITINDIENATIDPVGIIKVDYNSNKTITIIAKLGYNLVSVKVNGIEKINDMVYESLTLNNITNDVEVVVVVERNIYEVIEGANQTYTITKDDEAKFKINVEYSHFERGGSVYVDGVLLDTSNYTSESGSTIITLKKEYLDTLIEGVHTLKVLFTDGEANTTFTIAKISGEENPRTGDNLVTYILTGVISTLGLVGTGTYIFKRKHTN